MKTDTELRRDVGLELDWDPTVDSSTIAEIVNNGIVTLTGEVRSYAEKWHAERTVEHISGVRGVANEIKIRGVHDCNDTDIATAAADSLKWDALLPDDHIMIEVEGGHVTLSGEVLHDYQRRAAERNIRYLRGVKGLSNLITLKAVPAAQDLRLQIEDSFRRQAVLDAHHVTVAVDDGEVILSGTVRSWAERHDAETTAWAGSGVRSVTNNITVFPPG